VTSVHAAGDVIHYSITVENIGTNTLSQLTVTDPQVTHSTPIVDASAPIPNPDAQILVQLVDGDHNLGDTNQNNVRDPGETWQYANIGDTNQDGFHDPGETWTAFNLGDTNNDGIHQVGETWVGDTNQNGIQEAGEKWQFKNVGDTNHNGLQDPGETWHYQNVGDINDNGTQDLGETFLYYNLGDTNQNNNPDSGETFQYYNVGDTNHNGVEDNGETFQFDVNHNADGVDANHDGFNDGDTNQNGSLDVGETWQFTVSYTVTQGDIDNGGVVDPGLTHVNTSSATTDQGATGDATAQVSIVQNPHVTLTKTATVADGTADAAGDVINYAITVHNDGNMTLTGAVVSDPTVSGLAPVLSGGFNAGDLDHDGKIDVGETWQYTASHTVTQSDIDNGGVVNPALTYSNTASVTTAQGAADPDANDSDTASVAIVQNPHLTLVKSASVADGTADAAGDVINYTIDVTNDGNMTLTGAVVSDPSVSGLAAVLSGGFNAGDTDHDGKIDVGETWQYTASHTVTQDDIDNGGVVNPALTYDNTASVTTDQGASDSDSASVPIVQNPHLTLDKIATVPGGTADTAGEVISYSINVTNDGNMTLTGVSVNDPSVTDLAAVTSGGFNAGDTDHDGKLDIGETWQYTASHTVTQTDLDTNGGGDGTIDNTASVTTTQGASANDTASVTVVPPPAAEISIDDNNHLSQLVDPGGDGASVGDLIQFFFQITNHTSATLTSLAVTDTLGDIATPGNLQTPIPTSLAGNAGFGDTFNHHITMADLTAHHVVDDVTVTALDSLSVPQTATLHYDFHL
jgi:uncharacterized repeat protein (TIGR01451 family)